MMLLMLVPLLGCLHCEDEDSVASISEVPLVLWSFIILMKDPRNLNALLPSCPFC
jgi:hypothetical protein